MSWYEEQTYKPLCPHEKIGELEEEARLLLDNLSGTETAVGDALMIEFDPKWRNDNLTGRYGRLTIKDGRREYHAGHANICRTSHARFPERDFMTYMKAWDNGSARGAPAAELVKDPPQPTFDTQPMNAIQLYELELFTRLRLTCSVTLINPAMSTMASLKKCGGGFVALTSEVQEKWAFNIHDFVQKSGGTLKMIAKSKIEGVSYLGTNSPLFYPDTPWIRGIINPFVDQTHYYKSMRVDMWDHEVHMTIRKREDYEVYSVLDRDCPYISYNPETVDRFLRQKTRLLWLQGTFGLSLVEVEDRKISHTPWFLNYTGDWQVLDEDKWLVYQNYVVDIEGIGTYVSRRRKEPPAGYTWLPYQAVGSHVVTYSCLYPWEMLGLSVYVDEKISIASFDSAELVESVLKRWSGPGSYFNDSVGTLVDSDEGIHVTDVEPLNYFSYVYIDSNGRHYTEACYSADAIFVRLGGEKYVVPFVPGTIIKSLALRTPNRTVLVVPQNLSEERHFDNSWRKGPSQRAPEGQFLAFPGHESFSENLQLLSLFTSKVRTVESLVAAKTDSEYGGFGDNESTEMVKLENRVKQVVQKTYLDPGVSTGIAAMESGRSISGVYYFLRRLPHVWIWKDSSYVSTQFAHEESIKVRFEGTISERNFDGQKWSKVLSIITSSYNGKKMVFPFSLGIRLLNFRKLLLHNHCSARITGNQGSQLLEVVRGPF